MDVRVPEVGWQYVGRLSLSRHRFVEVSSLSTSRPARSVWLLPQRVLWALKSPRRMIGGGSC